MMIKRFLCLMICQAFLLPMGAIETVNDIPQLSVKGEAILFKPADQVQMTVGVVTQDEDPQQALQMNNVQMTQLIQNLDRLGLDKSEYQTGQFYINPIYSVPPRDPPPNWKQSITHYEVGNTLQIKTQKLDLVGRIIQTAAQAGSNRIDQITFNLSDARSYRNEAIETAAQYAISDAQTLAKATNVKLVRVRSIVLDPTKDAYPMPRQVHFSYAAAKDALGSTPIEAGEIEIRATVDMVFDIGPNDTLK